MKNQNLEQEKLMLEAAKKDKKKFDDIYKYFLNDVYRFSYSLVNNTQDAEDICSQAFIEFYKKLDTYEWQNISMKFWLFRAVRFISYKKFKTPSTEDLDENYHTKEDFEISFVDQIMNLELVEEVKKEIQNLKPISQELINLRIWEGLSFKEIAEIQDESENTIKTRFYRSIEKVKAELKKKNLTMFAAFPPLFTSIKQAGYTSNYTAPIELSSVEFEVILKNNSIISKTFTLTKTKIALSIAVSIGLTASAVGGGVYYINNRLNKSKQIQTNQAQVTPIPINEDNSSEETANSSKTESWKECSSAVLKISVKVPPEWDCNTEQIAIPGEEIVSIFPKLVSGKGIYFQRNYSPSINLSEEPTEEITKFTLGTQQYSLLHSIQGNGIINEITTPDDETLWILGGNAYQQNALAKEDTEAIRSIFETLEYGTTTSSDINLLDTSTWDSFASATAPNNFRLNQTDNWEKYDEIDEFIDQYTDFNMKYPNDFQFDIEDAFLSNLKISMSLDFVKLKSNQTCLDNSVQVGHKINMAEGLSATLVSQKEYFLKNKTINERVYKSEQQNNLGHYIVYCGVMNRDIAYVVSFITKDLGDEEQSYMRSIVGSFEFF